MKFVVILSAFLLIHSQQFMHAQSPLSVLESRLCREWSLESVEQNGIKDPTFDADNHFVLILLEDHTVQQGIKPDALIGGTWKVDEMKQTLLISDDATRQEYRMHIVTIADSVLLLRDESQTPPLLMHYGRR